MLGTEQLAPGFELESLEGHAWSLKGLLANGPVLLVFFKTSCPTCQFTLPFLNRLKSVQDHSGIRVVFISQDAAGATRQFVERFHLDALTLLDGPGYPVSNAFDIAYVPSLFLVEPDGEISLAGHGFARSDLEEIAARARLPIFRANEAVPEWKAG